MATPQQQNYQPPQCEDYHSDDSSEDHVLQESFRRSPSAAGQANVAAKRSHPSDLSTSGKSPAHEKVPVNIDLQSDSGYSSHTAATMSSADSAPSANASHSPPIPPASVAAPSMPPPSPATTAMRRRPTNTGDDRRTASQNSPRKPLQRTGSVSSRRKERRSTVTEECTVPDCECGHSRTTAAPSSSRTRRTTDSSPLDSGLDISYPPFDGTPSSPAYTRQRVPYQQGLAMVQPAQTRRRSSSTTRRPMSYHGEPGQGYWVPGMPAPYQPPTPQEIGPPLAMNNRYSMHPQQMPSYPVGPPTPGGYYSNGQVSQFDMRPSMVSRGSSSNYVTRSYGPTVVTQERNQYSARYPSQPQSARQERFPQFEDESSDSEDIYSSEEEEEEERSSRNARALVARPKVSKDMTQRRPSLRHANTTSVVTRRMSQSQAPLERPSRERRQSRERGPRSSRATTAVPSRNPSVSRPALIQHPKAQSYETTRNAQVVVENPRSRRRQSYQGYDSKVYDSKVYDSKVYDKVYANEAYDKEYILEQKRRNRASRSFRDDRDDHQDRHAREQEAVPLANSRRRQTDVDSRMRDESIIESNKRTQMDAEAYQQRVRGSYDPFTEQVHKAAKSASRIPSGGRSENGSSRSKGSDRASRVSQSNRTTVTSGGANGEIRLRVDPSAPLTLSFNGDMEGRTLQINPAEDGMADIVIGNSRGNENQYRSERGSVMGGAMGGARKAIMANQARREAEELSVKSSRSAQSRRDRERDGERRTLRRRRDIEYH